MENLLYTASLKAFSVTGAHQTVRSGQQNTDFTGIQKKPCYSSFYHPLYDHPETTFRHDVARRAGERRDLVHQTIHKPSSADVPERR
jgi:hypothetical protein